MRFYEHFEHVIALILSAVISIVIMIALWRLIHEVFTLMVLGAFDSLDHRIFQAVSEMIMNKE
jgi:hypothetical protein